MLQVAIKHDFADFALDIDFATPFGLTALFGLSGAGKTSVIRAVAGLLRPDFARITLNGVAVQDLPVHRRRMGYVFQEPRLFPHLSVQQNLRYGLRFAPQAGLEFGAVVGLLGLQPLLNRAPAALSGGEKQRVAIGRALLSNPQMLLMDEPFSALDSARKAEILPYLERLRDQAGLPILYVSHALPEVARLATTIVVLQQGRVVRVGPCAEVLADPAMAGVLGLRDAGALITARLVAHEADGLSQLQTAAGPVFLPHLSGPVGAVLRLRIPAQDVMLSLKRPTGISALNILPVNVVSVRIGDGPGAIISLALGAEILLARITRRSADAMNLCPGDRVFAVLKSVALAQGDVGL